MKFFNTSGIGDFFMDQDSHDDDLFTGGGRAKRRMRGMPELETFFGRYRDVGEGFIPEPPADLMKGYCNICQRPIRFRNDREFEEWLCPECKILVERERRASSLKKKERIRRLLMRKRGISEGDNNTNSNNINLGDESKQPVNPVNQRLGKRKPKSQNTDNDVVEESVSDESQEQNKSDDSSRLIDLSDATPLYHEDCGNLFFRLFDKDGKLHIFCPVCGVVLFII